MVAAPARSGGGCGPAAQPSGTRCGDRIQPATWGPVFNQMHWGGYLLYVRPDIPVFIDGQTDFYGEELAREYLAVLNGRAGWRAVLDKHDVEWTLIVARQPLAQLLALDREWSRVYSDAVAVIYRRRAPGSR